MTLKDLWLRWILFLHLFSFEHLFYSIFSVCGSDTRTTCFSFKWNPYKCIFIIKNKMYGGSDSKQILNIFNWRLPHEIHS